MTILIAVEETGEVIWDLLVNKIPGQTSLSAEYYLAVLF